MEEIPCLIWSPMVDGKVGTTMAQVALNWVAT
jgi:hypothetical protein